MFKGENGFTLAEIVAGVIILMILATVVGLAVFGYIKDARVASLKEEAIAVENDLLTNAGNYEYEGKEASELSEDVRAVLGYHESKDTKLEGLVFEDKALRLEGEIHVGKLSMPEEELGNYDFSESGIKQMKGNGIGNEFYVYDELNQVESNVGLLGDGSLTLPDGGENTIEGIEAYNGGSYVWDKEGNLYVAGNSLFEENNEDVRVSFSKTSTPGKVKQVLTTSKHNNFLLTKGGEVYSWGDNNMYTLGLDVRVNDIVFDMTKIETLSDIVELYASRYTIFARDSEGEVYSWGSGYLGTLGNGEGSSEMLPVRVSNLDMFEKIVGAGQSGIGLNGSGDVYAWGDEEYAGFGDGKDRLVPNKLKGLKNVVDISAGEYQNIALEDDGEVFAWGISGGNYLGVGSSVNAGEVPMKVLGLDGEVIVDVEAGYSYNLYALNAEGEVFSWGRNGDGQLGNGTVQSSGVPVKVEGLDNVKELSGGYHHVLALTHEGDLYAWGSNVSGELGDGTKISKSVPVKVDVGVE